MSSDEQGKPALDDWMKQLAIALELPPGFDELVDTVLDLARDAAHGVARPAAPLTTFLVGVAAGRAGGSAEDIRRLSAIAADLADRYDSGRP